MLFDIIFAVLAVFEGYLLLTVFLGREGKNVFAENQTKEDIRQIDYETGEIIETNEEIKTFDIEVAKMLYSMLDGKLTMK